MSAKLWGGRFSKKTASLMDEFNASIEFDQKLYKHDILGSIAHANMLAKQNIIAKEEAAMITATLQDILKEIEDGRIQFSIEYEDIHMNIEKILTDRTGEAGKRLHTARSRNDQVAVDIRLYLKDEILSIIDLLKSLMKTIATTAEKNRDTVMPGYTHLQRAQPVTLAYYVMAYFYMFKRDVEIGRAHV